MSLYFELIAPIASNRQRERPVELLAAAGEDDVLLAALDLLDAVADAVRAGRAGRGDRVVDALDPERRRQAGRDGRGHAAGDHERPHPLRAALLDHRAVRLEQVARRRPAGAGDQPGALVRDVALLEPGVGDRLLHGEVGEGRAVAHEAQLALVDMLGRRRCRACRAPGSGSRARRSRARS